MINEDQKSLDLIMYGFSASMTDKNGITKRINPQSVYAINAAHYGTEQAKTFNNLIISNIPHSIL